MAKSQEGADSIAQERRDLWSLFREVLHANDQHHSHHFEKLWACLAPNGNIYRRNAFFLEYRLHSLDLWRQMREIAEKHRPLLEGDDVKSIDECAEVLYDELQNTNFRLPGSDDETPEKVKGYPPIEELLSEKVEQWGPFVLYKDADKRSEEIKHRLIALNVFLLQTIAPFLIFLNRWEMPTNHFKRMFNPKYVLHKLTMAELLCFGITFEDVCTTLLGVQLLFAIIFITRCYVDQQVSDNHKWQHLPHSSFWHLMDVFANAWCVVFILFGIPLLFWSEQSPTNIVLDSMTLLFLFKLDDLSDVLCSYVGMTQVDFQRTVASMTAFLAQCPVDLENVINPDAKNSKELWCIQVDKKGNVVGSDKSVCTTRLQFNDEAQTAFQPVLRPHTRSRRFIHYGSTQALLASTSSPSTGKVQLTCHRSRLQCEVLPSVFTVVLTGVWEVLAWIVWTANIVIPVVWYLINKPCYPLTHGLGK